MTDVMTILRAVVRDELKTLHLGELAVVTKVYPHADGDENNYDCDAKLRESDLELKRVPIATPHVGMVSAPAVGDLVLVTFVAGDANRPVVVGRLYSDESNPPVHEKEEWRVESPLGGVSSLAIDKEGSLVVTAGKTVVTIKKDGPVEIRGETDLAVQFKGDAKIQVDGNTELKTTDCKVDASGKVELGSGGGGVITTKSHKCYITGAPLVGSQNVTAKD